MKKIILLTAVLAIVALFVVSTAHAVALNWANKNTVIVDHTVQVTKPNSKWDTQTKHYKDPAPVKWVRHISGANPQMYLRYKYNVTGQTAHAYSKQVGKELSNRGIRVIRTEKKVINARNVAIVHGTRGEEQFMVGVWRHKDIGFQLECVAVHGKFDRYVGEFYQAINSVRILKESGL